VKGLRHRTRSQQGGSPLGGSQSPAPVVIAGNVRIVSSLCPVSDSFPFSGRVAGDSDWLPLALYSRGRCMCSELRHGLSPARSRRPDGPTAQA
jgi:hypothetical protein